MWDLRDNRLISFADLVSYIDNFTKNGQRTLELPGPITEALLVRPEESFPSRLPRFTVVEPKQALFLLVSLITAASDSDLAKSAGSLTKFRDQELSGRWIVPPFIRLWTALLRDSDLLEMGLMTQTESLASLVKSLGSMLVNAERTKAYFASSSLLAQLLGAVVNSCLNNPLLLAASPILRTLPESVLILTKVRQAALVPLYIFDELYFPRLRELYAQESVMKALDEDLQVHLCF